MYIVPSLIRMEQRQRVPPKVMVNFYQGVMSLKVSIVIAMEV
jgi:hypothetical protein